MISQPERQEQTTLDLYASPSFAGWLQKVGGSIAFTTYQAGRLLFLGHKSNGQLWLHERAFEHCQGLWSDGKTIWVSSLYQLWHMRNMLEKGTGIFENGCDANFHPLAGYTTGNLDIHDIGMDKQDRPIFVNTRFNCLSTLSETGSFKVMWKPPFISEIISEDRCHLNGLAMKNHKPKYITAISKSDVLDGWRDRRSDGGIVMDVEKNEVVADGLSMPHSPRLYRNKLWLLNSGTGYFGYVDIKTGKFEPVCFCPGYMRGLAFVGDYAIIGLSLPRQKHTFDGLPLEANLKAKDAPARCGLVVIDINNGSTEEWLRINAPITELYDVAFLPEMRQPRAVSLRKKEEISTSVFIENGL